MIIFDLDGTLADCEHRRHFVDRNHPINFNRIYGNILNENQRDPEPESPWLPNWQAFYEACDKDKPIKEVCEALHCFSGMEKQIQIWSGRCESVREKTIDWLIEYADIKYITSFDFEKDLKMRPIRDSTPDDVLKAKWLDEAIAKGQKPIMVFDDHPKVIRMWQRRGIFVFNCCQHNNEF